MASPQDEGLGQTEAIPTEQVNIERTEELFEQIEVIEPTEGVFDRTDTLIERIEGVIVRTEAVIDRTGDVLIERREVISERAGDVLIEGEEVISDRTEAEIDQTNVNGVNQARGGDSPISITPRELGSLLIPIAVYIVRTYCFGPIASQARAVTRIRMSLRAVYTIIGALLLITTATVAITSSTANNNNHSSSLNPTDNQEPLWFSDWLNAAGDDHNEDLQLWCERTLIKPSEWRIVCHSKPKAERRTNHQLDFGQSLTLQGDQLNGLAFPRSLCCKPCPSPQPGLLRIIIKIISRSWNNTKTFVSNGITSFWSCIKTFVHVFPKVSKVIITRPTKTVTNIVTTTVNGVLHILRAIRYVIKETYYEARVIINLDNCQRFSSTLSDGFEEKLRQLLEKEIEELLRRPNCISNRRSCEEIVRWKIGKEFNEKFGSILQSMEHVIMKKIEEKAEAAEAPTTVTTHVITEVIEERTDVITEVIEERTTEVIEERTTEVIEERTTEVIEERHGYHTID